MDHSLTNLRIYGENDQVVTPQSIKMRVLFDIIKSFEEMIEKTAKDMEEPVNLSDVPFITPHAFEKGSVVFTMALEPEVWTVIAFMLSFFKDGIYKDLPANTFDGLSKFKKSIAQHNLGVELRGPFNGFKLDFNGGTQVLNVKTKLNKINTTLSAKCIKIDLEKSKATFLVNNLYTLDIKLDDGLLISLVAILHSGFRDVSIKGSGLYDAKTLQVKKFNPVSFRSVNRRNTIDALRSIVGEAFDGLDVTAAMDIARKSGEEF